jgi:hypothetical protein
VSAASIFVVGCIAVHGHSRHSVPFFSELSVVRAGLASDHRLVVRGLPGALLLRVLRLDPIATFDLVDGRAARNVEAPPGAPIRESPGMILPPVILLGSRLGSGPSDLATAGRPAHRRGPMPRRR